ncbi:MAG TPA: HNH endonuclease signature motif containing protein, partial [Nocardioides sp.]
GRSRRLFTPAQRKTLRLLDRQCRADGCTVPATWCEAHHTTPWTHGGNTDLVDGILLCTHHHHRAHDPAYTTQRLPNGDLRYHRRT